LSLVRGMPGHPLTTRGFAGAHCMWVRCFGFCAGRWKGARGGGQGEVSVRTWLLGCRFGTGGFVISGAGAVGKVIVVFVIEWGERTRARWSTVLMTHVISARSISDFAIKFLRAWDCCLATSRMLMDCWRTVSNVAWVCWGGEGSS